MKINKIFSRTLITITVIPLLMNFLMAVQPKSVTPFVTHVSAATVNTKPSTIKARGYYGGIKATFYYSKEQVKALIPHIDKRNYYLDGFGTWSALITAPIKQLGGLGRTAFALWGIAIYLTKPTRVNFYNHLVTAKNKGKGLEWSGINWYNDGNNSPWQNIVYNYR
ncbi:MAG: hypothetical protein ABF682_00885 [Liquorilactobacillus sp.]|uniref:hypothetical protein n=1 Tax=Liquorilactobacillus sp. TaxID=2767923 RepID=UPI0039E76A14